jgi:hypothetical protein
LSSDVRAASFWSRGRSFPQAWRGEVEREPVDPRRLRRISALAGAGVMLILASLGAFEPSRAGVLASLAGCCAVGGWRARGVGSFLRAGVTAAAAFYATAVLIDAATHVLAWTTR